MWRRSCYALSLQSCQRRGFEYQCSSRALSRPPLFSPSRFVAKSSFVRVHCSQKPSFTRLPSEIMAGSPAQRSQRSSITRGRCSRRSRGSTHGLAACSRERHDSHISAICSTVSWRPCCRLASSCSVYVAVTDGVVSCVVRRGSARQRCA